MPDDEPFWSGRRLVSAWQIAALCAFALIGIKPIFSGASLSLDVAYRVVCLASAFGTAWWMYHGSREPGKPWLSDSQADWFGRAVEVVSVVGSIAVLLVLVAMLVLWWLT